MPFELQPPCIESGPLPQPGVQVTALPGWHQVSLDRHLLYIDRLLSVGWTAGLRVRIQLRVYFDNGLVEFGHF